MNHKIATIIFLVLLGVPCTAQLVPYNYFYRYICFRLGQSIIVDSDFYIVQNEDSLIIEKAFHTIRTDNNFTLNGEPYDVAVYENYGQNKPALLIFHLSNLSKEDIYLYLYIEDGLYCPVYNFDRQRHIFFDEINLSEGTYFINWYDPDYSINHRIYNELNRLNEEKKTLLNPLLERKENLLVSIDSLYGSTKQRDIDLYFNSVRQRIQLEEGMTKIESSFMNDTNRYLGYYVQSNYYIINGDFSVKRKALIEQKISSSPISPVEFGEFVEKLTEAEVKKVFDKLGIFN